MKYCAVILVALMLTPGCAFFREKFKPATKTYDKGNTPEQINSAADLQVEATDRIGISVDKTVANVTEPTIVLEEQKKITNENSRLKTNIVILKKEAEVKSNWGEERTSFITQLAASKQELTNMQKQRDEYKSRFEGAIGKVMMGFLIIGCILIPLGIMATIKMADPSYILVSALGISLIVTAKLVNWLQDNWMYPAGFAGAIIAWSFWRMYITHRRSLGKAVEINEQLKAEVKALPVANPNDTVNKAKNPRLILTKMFGDTHTEGEAGKGMDDQTKKLIAVERAKIGKKWAPVIP